jgi:hypothetical protein
MVFKLLISVDGDLWQESSESSVGGSKVIVNNKTRHGHGHSRCHDPFHARKYIIRLIESHTYLSGAD